MKDGAGEMGRPGGVCSASGGAGWPHGGGKQPPDEGTLAWAAWWRLQAPQLRWGG